MSYEIGLQDIENKSIHFTIGELAWDMDHVLNLANLNLKDLDGLTPAKALLKLNPAIEYLDKNYERLNPDDDSYDSLLDLLERTKRECEREAFPGQDRQQHGSEGLIMVQLAWEDMTNDHKAALLMEQDSFRKKARDKTAYYRDHVDSLLEESVRQGKKPKTLFVSPYEEFCMFGSPCLRYAFSGGYVMVKQSNWNVDGDGNCFYDNMKVECE